MGQGRRREFIKQKRKNPTDAGGFMPEIPVDKFPDDRKPKAEETVGEVQEAAASPIGMDNSGDLYDSIMAKRDSQPVIQEPITPAEKTYQPSQVEPKSTESNEQLLEDVKAFGHNGRGQAYDPEAVERQLDSMQKAIDQASPDYQTPQEVGADLEKQVVELTGHPSIARSDLEEKLEKPDEQVLEKPVDISDADSQVLPAIGDDLDELITQGAQSSSDLTQSDAGYEALPPDSSGVFDAIPEGEEATPAIPEYTPTRRIPIRPKREGFFKYMWRNNKTGLAVMGLFSTMAILAGYVAYSINTAKWNDASTKRTKAPTRVERLTDRVEPEMRMLTPMEPNYNALKTNEARPVSNTSRAASNLSPVKIAGQEYDWISVNPDEIKAKDPNYAGKDIFEYALKRKGSNEGEKPRVFVRNPRIAGILLREDQNIVTRNINGSPFGLHKTNRGITMIQDYESRKNKDGTIMYSPKNFGDSYVLTE